MPTTKKTKAKRMADRQTRSKEAASNRGAKTQGMNAIELLEQDHQEVIGYFDEYEQIEDEGEKGELALKICLALTVHTQIEEEIFYPAARKAIKDDDLLDEAEVEHDGAKKLIAEIQGMEPGDDLYDAKVKVLGEQIKHHVEEEQDELFPECESAKMDLEGLGSQMAKRKDQLMKQSA